MTTSETVARRAFLAIVVLAGSLVLVRCDLAATGSTAVLNAESAIPPTVEYTFEYASSDVTGEGEVAVVSEEQDDLGDILSQNGFSRADVVSAEIDSVSIERLSAQTFGYVTGADLYLGMNAEGPHVGTGTFQTSQESARLDIPTKTVTGLVKEGSTNTFARLDVGDRSNVPSLDRVGVTVFFRIEVGGV